MELQNNLMPLALPLYKNKNIVVKSVEDTVLKKQQTSLTKLLSEFCSNTSSGETKKNYFQTENRKGS